MEETAIRPGYTVPTETDGTPADYSAIEAAVNAHNQNAQPGEAYWGIRLCGAEYEVYEYGEVHSRRPPKNWLHRKRRSKRQRQSRKPWTPCPKHWPPCKAPKPTPTAWWWIRSTG